MIRRVLKVSGIVLALLLLAGAGMVAYAAATADGRMAFPDAPEPRIAASTDPLVIEQGRYLVNGPAHCSACHSGAAGTPPDRSRPDMIGQLPLAGGLSFPMGPLGTRFARNLTPDPATGIGAQSDAQVARAIRSGVLHDGELSFFMKFAASNLSDEDLVAVISYLRSLEPVANPVPPGSWAIFGKVLMTYAFPPMEPRPAQGPAHVPAGEEPTVERGRYLAEDVMLCTSCHTAMDPMSFEYVGEKGAGGFPEASHGEDTDMEFVAPNLTAHATGVTGRLSEDEFVARMRGGRAFPSSIMPWENFAVTTESDIRSVYRYLRTLPPVDNDVGPTYRPIGSAGGEG